MRITEQHYAYWVIHDLIANDEVHNRNNKLKRHIQLSNPEFDGLLKTLVFLKETGDLVVFKKYSQPEGFGFHSEYIPPNVIRKSLEDGSYSEKWFILSDMADINEAKDIAIDTNKEIVMVYYLGYQIFIG